MASSCGMANDWARRSCARRTPDGQVQHDEWVRVSAPLVHLQHRETRTYPHLARPLDGAGFAEVAVVEHGQRDHRACRAPHLDSSFRRGLHEPTTVRARAHPVRVGGAPRTWSARRRGGRRIGNSACGGADARPPCPSTQGPREPPIHHAHVADGRALLGGAANAACQANSSARPQTDVHFAWILFVWVEQWGRVRACPGMRWPCVQRMDASFDPILSATAKNAHIVIFQCSKQVCTFKYLLSENKNSFTTQSELSLIK